MIYLRLETDGFEPLIRELKEFVSRVSDVAPLAHSLADVVSTQNRNARLAGVDRDNVPFQDLADATWRRHPYRGMGPPLAGMEDASRIVSDFRVDVIRDGISSATVVGYWPGMDDFILYHVLGTRHMPARNPAGITPAGWAAVGDAFDAWVDGIAGAAL